MDDLYLALTRLIAANLGVIRWVIRLNTDYNNESYVILDVERMSLILDLRAEQFTLLGDKDNTASWFSRPVQLTVRKRILAALKKEFTHKARICRRDIFGSWDNFARLLKLYGGVVEAEPIEKLGHVVSMCFISPNGEVSILGGVQELRDELYQVQGYIYPQNLTPPIALNGVSQALANKLYQDYRIIGYVNFQFISFWDDLDQQPRLWASDIKFGLTPLHGAFGTTAIMTNIEHPVLPFSLIPEMPQGRSFVYIPLAAHDGLKSAHDDSFFKLCRMRGIAYDTEHRIGTLFFMADTVVSGTVSALCTGKSRRRSIEIAVQTFTFIQKNFGMDSEDANTRRAENLTKILLSLKKALKNEPEDMPF